MALANDAIIVTPGSGATVATFSPGGSNTTEYQVTMLANATGNIVDSMPTYGLNVPQLLLAANKYHWELFNHPSSAKTLTIRGVWAVPELSQTITGNVGDARFELYRTTAVSSGGTASAAFESANTILANFFRMDTNDASLSSHISAKTQLTSITTGTFLYPWYVCSTATTLIGGISLNGINALQQNNNVIPQREFGEELVVRAGTGLACRQGTVASAGSVGWLIEFTVDP
jgi:hypothetical protein